MPWAILAIVLAAPAAAATPNPYFPWYPNTFPGPVYFSSAAYPSTLHWPDGTVSTTAATSGGGGFTPVLCTLPQVSLGNSCSQPTNVLGSAAGASSAGWTGGAGGSGLIIVEEFY